MYNIQKKYTTPKGDSIKITYMKIIRIAALNIRRLQDEIELTTVFKVTNCLGIGILAIQESRRTSSDLIAFEDDSIKKWQLVQSRHKRKDEHGAALLLAPHVKIEDHTEHFATRIHLATMTIRDSNL